MTCQKWFCVAGAILLPCFQKMRYIFRGRRSTLQTCNAILRGRRNTLDVSCCVFSANRRVKSVFAWQTPYFCHVFRRCVAFFVAGAALYRCPKSFCVVGAILCTCRISCLLRRSTLQTSNVILRGRRRTLDVSCCVFSANRLRYENRRKRRTKGRFCGRSIRKFVGKR